MDVRIIFLLVDVETVSAADKDLLEVGWQFTDSRFNPLSGLENRIVRHPDGFTDLQERSMFGVHRTNGLYDSIKNGQGDALDKIIDEIMSSIRGRASAGEVIIPAGDTVGFDMAALRLARPDVFRCCDYHVMDLSSIRIGLSLWSKDGFDMDRTVDHRVRSCLDMELHEGQIIADRLGR